MNLKLRNVFLVVLLFLMIISFILLNFRGYLGESEENFNFKLMLNEEGIELNNIIESQNFIDCDLLVDENEIKICKIAILGCVDDYCFFEKAYFDLNISTCYSIENVSLRKICKNIIFKKNSNSVQKDICNELNQTNEIINCWLMNFTN